MRVTLKHRTGALTGSCVVEREPGDPVIERGGNSSAEAVLLERVREELLGQGYVLVRVRMREDGHPVGDDREYLREPPGRPRQFAVYDAGYPRPHAVQDFNVDDEAVLAVRDLAGTEVGFSPPLLGPIPSEDLRALKRGFELMIPGERDAVDHWDLLLVAIAESEAYSWCARTYRAKTESTLSTFYGHSEMDVLEAANESIGGSRVQATVPMIRLFKRVEPEAWTLWSEHGLDD